MKIGYHTLVTIPAGAMYVNITEMTRSRNYLGLQISGGNPVFNGGWSIDYPGNYSAGGTNVMYTRSARSMSSRGEQILIMGPTSVDLDVKIIYQERNPGISYEYVIPNPPEEKEERPPPRRQEEEEGGRQTSQQNPRVQPKATRPPSTTTRPTTTPPTTTARTTTRSTIRPTTTVPTTPPPPPPLTTTNAPIKEEQPKSVGEKEMSISSGVLPGNGMGDKETPEGYPGVRYTISESEETHRENQGLEAGPEGRYYNRPEGSPLSGVSTVSGSVSRSNPTVPEGQRPSGPSVETGLGSSRPSNPGRSNTGRGRDTIYVPSESSGNVPATQTEILRGGERGQGETPREQGQGDATGRAVPPVYVSNPQLGRGPSPANSERQTSATGTGTQREPEQSRPFYGYYPTGYNPPETRVPESDAIPPVSSNSQLASQSSFNRPTGNNPPNPQGSSGSSRPFNYNPNLPGGRGTTDNSGPRGPSHQNLGTTAQSGVTSGRFTSGTNYNPQSRYPTGNRNPSIGPNPGRPRPMYGGDEPSGDIVYNPNYRPPTNQGFPPYNSQGVPSRGQPSNPTGQGIPVNGQGTPSQTGGYRRPGVGQDQPTFGQGRPNIGQGVPSRGQGVPPQTRPDRYPFRPNPDAIPDMPPQTSSNLPQTSGQIGIYPNPGQQPPSGPIFGQENPETNYSPLNSGVPRPVVPIGGEELDAYTSEDYSSSIPEEGQGNEATFDRLPGEPHPAVNPEALYIWMETGVTECSVSCAGGKSHQFLNSIT
ncbi:mucin-5AC-like [Lytechinus pictus]|uniref:mucin-5AC-like n=1 Tax=Lytechinus pictus TaxID=7653 RepID=UPI0030B9CC58